MLVWFKNICPCWIAKLRRSRGVVYGLQNWQRGMGRGVGIWPQRGGLDRVVWKLLIRWIIWGASGGHGDVGMFGRFPGSVNLIAIILNGV